MTLPEQSSIDATCPVCVRDEKGTYRTEARCTNCGWTGEAIHSHGHAKGDNNEECPQCGARRIQMGDFLAEPVSRWTVQPLVELEAEVPMAWRIEGATDKQVRVTLNVGDVLLIDGMGTVRNTYGTPIFRLIREEATRS